MREFLDNIAFIISITSLCIIAYGAIIAITKFVLNEIKRFRGNFQFIEINVIRLQFGYYLLLGLEFLIASDIIRTILDPTDHDLIVLGGIVLIRTLLTYFLNREIRMSKVSGETELK